MLFGSAVPSLIEIAYFAVVAARLLTQKETEAVI
jgi:hypothetical protein